MRVLWSVRCGRHVVIRIIHSVRSSSSGRRPAFGGSGERRPRESDPARRDRRDRRLRPQPSSRLVARGDPLHHRGAVPDVRRRHRVDQDRRSSHRHGDNQRPWHQSNPHRLRDGPAGRAALPGSLDRGHSCRPNRRALRRLGGPASAATNCPMREGRHERHMIAEINRSRLEDLRGIASKVRSVCRRSR